MLLKGQIYQIQHFEKVTQNLSSHVWLLMTFLI